MPGLPAALVIGTAATFALCGDIAPEAARPAVPSVRIETMPFADCTSLVEEIAQEMDVDPTDLVRTADLWLSRLDAADGVLVVSCSRSDEKLTVLTFRGDRAPGAQTGAVRPASS
jgi:hypothetical protein